MGNICYEQMGRSYIERVIFSLFNPYLAFLLILFFISGAFIVSIKCAIILCICLFFYLLIIEIFDNVIHLKSINIDPHDRTISILILKFNTVYIKKSYSINEIEIEFIERRLVHRSYYLQIMHNNKRIIKQSTVGGWRKKMFEEIVEEYKKLR
jgi:hypothetical protein